MKYRESEEMYLETILLLTQSNDRVRSIDVAKELFESKKVTKSYKHYNTPRVIKVILSNNVVLKITPGHPILTTEGWKSLRPDSIEAKRENIEGLSLLEVGDTLVGYDENVTIVKVEQRPEVEDYYTYNLGVEGHHNYIVEGIVAHNVINHCRPQD